MTQTFPGEPCNMVTWYGCAMASCLWSSLLCWPLSWFSSIPSTSWLLTPFPSVWLACYCSIASFSSSHHQGPSAASHLSYIIPDFSHLRIPVSLFFSGVNHSHLIFLTSFIWTFESCPKWTICSLVLGIMFYSYCNLAQKDKYNDGVYFII